MLTSFKVIAESGVQFGTSGARGLVEQFSSEVCAAFTHSFINVMKRSFKFTQLAIAIDNRPSSYAMAMACAKACEQSGVEPVYYGVIPTPALAYKAMQDKMPSIMVTGSHIPFDRNGLKFYRPDGEISKADELSILSEKAEFNAISSLPGVQPNESASLAYVKRYTSLFNASMLASKKIGIYEHSSAGRDLYKKLFTALGAEVVTLGRSDEFVPIDTEAVSEEDQQKALDWSKVHNFDMIFSTDGDGDRPLIADEKGNWLRGDVLGAICAHALNLEAVAVPISCNTLIESSDYFKSVTRTKIGSPYVIAEFAKLEAIFASVGGFEANGGFMLGSDIEVGERTLRALPTRDAVLPALMLLKQALEDDISTVVNRLPKRYTASGRIQDFDSDRSSHLMKEIEKDPSALLQSMGVGKLTVTDKSTVDGLRLTLSNGEVFHLRPSGNAPELRCYVEASSESKARNNVAICLDVISAF
ncbi:phosphomannomutase [Thalassotalea euphylliae]|uniref:Phosphomannomutase n=1 Tax=Thalassotalea euphylliae TaxID=1655234 RepID=A0A3E0U1U3_9GAMM|nr:phosphomannomutase [Thalassotalea euphylliae]REL30185.1 phosphomannomutase [Thalassotalea euphylliae]